MVKNLEFNCRLAIISRRFLQNPQSARRKPPPAINCPHSAARTPSPAARRARLCGRATAARNPPRAVGLAHPTVSDPLPATRCMRSAAIAFLRAIERGQPGFITRIPSSCPNAASHRTHKRTLAGGVASVRCSRGGTLSKERERGESARLRDMVWRGAPSPSVRDERHRRRPRERRDGCAAYFAFSTGSAIFTGAGVPPWPFFG